MPRLKGDRRRCEFKRPLTNRDRCGVVEFLGLVTCSLDIAPVEVGQPATDLLLATLALGVCHLWVLTPHRARLVRQGSFFFPQIGTHLS